MTPTKFKMITFSRTGGWPCSWAITIGLFSVPQFRFFRCGDTIVTYAVRFAWLRASLVYAKPIRRSS